MELGNRTHTYLSPIISTYRHTFCKQLESLNKVAWGIGDMFYRELHDCKYNLFLLVANKDIQGFLDYFRSSSYYTDDYKYDDKHHILVIQISKRFYKAYDNFLKSQYSEMYELKEVRTLVKQFIGGKPNPTFYILVKDDRYEKVFRNILIETFNLDKDFKIDVSDREWDFPIKLQEEVFNYEQGNISSGSSSNRSSITS